MCLFKKKKAKGDSEAVKKSNKLKDETKKSKDSAKSNGGDKSALTQTSTTQVEAEKSLAPTLFTFDDPPASNQGEVNTDLSTGDDINPFAATDLQSKLMGTTSNVNTVKSTVVTPVGLSPLARTEESSKEPTPTGTKILEEAKTKEKLSEATVDAKKANSVPAAKKLSEDTSEDKEKSSVSLCGIPRQI